MSREQYQVHIKVKSINYNHVIETDEDFEILLSVLKRVEDEAKKVVEANKTNTNAE